MKFLVLNVDFSSARPDPLGSRRPAQAGVRNSYPPKNGYFAFIGSCSVKTVAGRHILYMLLIITSNNDTLFIDVNVDDLE